MPDLTSTTLGRFCREIAGGLSPLPTLLEEWGLDSEAFDALRVTPGYAHEMKVILAEMAEMGADAGYIYRMKALSEEFIADIVNIMKADNTPVSTKVDLIKFVADLARLKEKPVSAAQAQLDNRPRGPSVVFNFGAGLPIKSMQVLPDPIDVTPSQPDGPIPLRRGFGLDLA